MFFSERISDHHEVERFDCGNEELSEWLRTSALTADRAGTARTHVWLGDTDDVVAYFAISPHTVRRDELPPKIGRGSPDSVPAFLLAKLALSTPLRGEDLGPVLLADALATCLDAIRVGGGRIVVVDAIGERAARFYSEHHFKALPDVNPLRLFRKASEIAKDLDQPWP